MSIKLAKNTGPDQMSQRNMSAYQLTAANTNSSLTYRNAFPILCTIESTSLSRALCRLDRSNAGTTGIAQENLIPHISCDFENDPIK